MEEDEEPLFAPETVVLEANTSKNPIISSPPASTLSSLIPQPPHLPVPLQESRLSISPPVNMDHSWSFSMMSDDEEDEPLDDIPTIEKINKSLITNTAPMANWQIDTASSVTGPNETSRADSISIPVPSIPDDEASVTNNNANMHLSQAATSAIPPFTIPQKRTLPNISPPEQTATIHTNKRISLPYINKRQELLNSVGTSDIVEDFITPSPSKLPTAAEQSQQIPRSPHSVGLLTNKVPHASPLDVRSTLTQKQLSPSVVPTQPRQPTTTKTTTTTTTTTAKPKTQLNLLQAFSQKSRNQNKLSSTSVNNTNSPHLRTTTLNQSLVIPCDFNRIKANYPKFKKQHDKIHHVCIEDYLALNYQMSNNNSNAQLISTSTTATNGLSFYSRGGTHEIGVVKLKTLCINTIYNQLWRDHKVICKKSLDRPVQIQFRYVVQA